MPMIRCRSAESLEELPTRLQRPQIAAPRSCILARQLSKSLHILAKTRKCRIHHRVRPERRHNPSLPTRLADRLVIGQRIKRRIRRRQHFDPESFEQGPRQKLLLAQLPFNRVVIQVCCFRRQSLLHSKKFFECVIKPQARRRPAKQVVIAREDPPHLAWIFDRLAADLQFFERNSLAVEHAKDIMIRLNKQRHGIRKRLVARKPPSLRVPVRAHNRQVLDPVIEPPRNRPRLFLCGKQSVLVKQRHPISPFASPLQYRS